MKSCPKFNKSPNLVTLVGSYYSVDCDSTIGQNSKNTKGGRPGPVDMGRDSCSKGCEFESQHRILDGHFFTYLIIIKICNVFEKTKINEKEAGNGLMFFKNSQNTFYILE